MIQLSITMRYVFSSFKKNHKRKLNEQITIKIIQAKERGKPRISGVAEANKG
jgi:hypothetical protein